MQVLAQKTKEAEITEQNLLPQVSLLPITLPFSTSILCNSTGFGRLPTDRNIVRLRCCPEVSDWCLHKASRFHCGLPRSNWGRFEHHHACVLSCSAFAGVLVDLVSVSPVKCADSSALGAWAVGFWGPSGL